MSDCPVWQRRDFIMQMFGIPRTVLDELAKSGAIRARKLNEARQGAVVYRVSDVAEWMENEAAKVSENERIKENG